MPNWRLFLRRLLRTRGWELRRFDPDLRLDTFLWSLFPHLGINCVIDVGARYGEYGRFLRNNGYTGKIHSFEPVSANVERLRQESAGEADWTLHHCGPGSAANTLTMNVTRGTNYSSLLVPSDYGRSVDEEIAVAYQEKVPLQRLNGRHPAAVPAQGGGS